VPDDVLDGLQLDLGEAHERAPYWNTELIASYVREAGGEQLLAQPLALPAEGAVAVEDQGPSLVADHEPFDFETPGFGATFRARGMWLIAYSRYGRVSSTTALSFARTRFSSSVLNSVVLCFGS
jgi:hypothetical protein